MALDVNGYNETFKAFVDFAKISEATTGKKTIVRADVDENGALVGRKVDVAETDHLRGLFRWSRKDDDKAANNATRAIFKDAIVSMFGGESKIPESVKKAMLMADYDCGKPLTARRIIYVKNAIDADGGMKRKAFEQAVVKFKDPDVKAAALAKGYSEAELPKIARATNLYMMAMHCSEMQALEEVTKPGSKANRLMNYGGRFMQTAENFANGLRLIDSFATWFKDVVDTLEPVYKQRLKARDFSPADTPTKMNISCLLLHDYCVTGLEKFVFEELAINSKHNLSERNAENLFGFKNNAAMRFFGRGYGASAYSTLAGMPPAKRQTLYAVMDLFTKDAKNLKETREQNLGPGRRKRISDGPKFIGRIIRNFEAIERLQRDGKLTAKNILDKFFPDITDKGKYDYNAVNKAFGDLAAMLNKDEDEGNIYSDINANVFLLMMDNTGSTVEETAAALRSGKYPPIPKYICTGSMELEDFNGTTKGGRKMLEADLYRPSDYSYLGGEVDLLAKSGNGARFMFNFPDGESVFADGSPAGKGNIKTVGDKIIELCGAVHVDQANSVMTMVSQSGLNSLRGGLPGMIKCDEHASVDMTLSKNEETGDITIQYSSPKELKFAFGWTATVKPDGSVTATPLRFKSEQQLADAVAKIKGELNSVQQDPALDKAIEKLVESVKGDPDLVDMLQFDTCDAAYKILIEPGSRNGVLRTEEKQAERLAAIKSNLSELRQVTNGDMRTYNMTFRQFMCFGGKALKPGLITKMFKAAKKVDISALNGLPANASPKKMAEYLCSVEKAANAVIRGTNVWKEMGKELGSGDALPLNRLVMGILFSRCATESLKRALRGLYSENGCKVAQACTNFNDEEYSKSVGNEVRRQKPHVTSAIKTVVRSFAPLASFRQAISQTLATMLGVKEPEASSDQLVIRDSEYLDIYKTFRQHTIENHPETVEKERNAAPVKYTTY